MLRYTTYKKFESEVPTLIQAMATNDTQDFNVNGNFVIDKLSSAESMVDGYLQTRYSVPVKSEDGTVPVIIVQAVHTIAKYYLYQRRNNVTADIQAQYENIIQWLKDVSTGKSNIAVANEEGETDESFEIDIVTGEEDPQMFGRGWQ